MFYEQNTWLKHLKQSVMAHKIGNTCSGLEDWGNTCVWCSFSCGNDVWNLIRSGHWRCIYNARWKRLCISAVPLWSDHLKWMLMAMNRDWEYHHPKHSAGGRECFSKHFILIGMAVDLESNPRNTVYEPGTHTHTNVANPLTCIFSGGNVENLWNSTQTETQAHDGTWSCEERKKSHRVAFIMFHALWCHSQLFIYIYKWVYLVSNSTEIFYITMTSRWHHDDITTHCIFIQIGNSLRSLCSLVEKQ